MGFRVFRALPAGLLLVAAATGNARAADMADPAGDAWTGFYLGVQAGYVEATGSNAALCLQGTGIPAQCSSDAIGQSNLAGIPVGDNTMAGGALGGYLGVNYRIDRIVLGLEGDANWLAARGSHGIDGGLDYDSTLKWDASIRARMGWLLDERALLYVTGGPSWIGADIRSDICNDFRADSPGAALDCSDSQTLSGWQLGAGAELMVTEHLSARAEYLHGWYGNADMTLFDGSADTLNARYTLKQDLQTNLFRAGLSYHFGGF